MILSLRCPYSSAVTVAFGSRLLDNPKVYVNVDASQTVDSLVDVVTADSGLQGVDRGTVVHDLLFLDVDGDTRDHRTHDPEGDVILTVLGTHASLYSASAASWNNLTPRRFQKNTKYFLPLINETHSGLQSAIDSREVGNRYDDFLSDFLAGEGMLAVLFVKSS